MAWLAEFFIVGSLGFWLLLAGSFAAMTALTETDSPWWAAIVFLGLGATLCTSNGWGVSTIINNPLETSAVIAGYFLCGVLWSLVKWWRFLVTAVEKYNEHKEQFFAGRRLMKQKDETQEEILFAWREFARSTYRWDEIHLTPPKPSKYKKQIITWMMYWPLSAVLTMFDDPIRRIFNMLYAQCTKTYEQISNHVFGAVKRDFE